jgi:hypothetical protein
LCLFVEYLAIGRLKKIGFGRTGADAHTKAKNQQKLKQTRKKAGKANSKRPGGAPAKKNASKGKKKTLADAVDDEDLKAAFDG